MARTVRDDHCYHVEEIDAIKAVKSTVFPVICCWCGKKESATLAVKTIPGHGLFVRLSQLEYPAKEICVSQ